MYAWCKGERGPPVLSTRDENGSWLLEPDKVAQEAARQWGELWCPYRDNPHLGQPQDGDPAPLPALEGQLLWDIVRRIPRDKAQGVDSWGARELKALPRQAYDDLAAVLGQIEKEGQWPPGLLGAIVTLLPKKGDPGPLDQRPISLLPMVYRLWAAARGAILKDWFEEKGHPAAWGQGKGRGADTAAWVGAAQAELAAGQGQAAFPAVSKHINDFRCDT